MGAMTEGTTVPGAFRTPVLGGRQCILSHRLVKLEAVPRFLTLWGLCKCCTSCGSALVWKGIVLTMLYRCPGLYCEPVSAGSTAVKLISVPEKLWRREKGSTGLEEKLLCF